MGLMGTMGFMTPIFPTSPILQIIKSLAKEPSRRSRAVVDSFSDPGIHHWMRFLENISPILYSMVFGPLALEVGEELAVGEVEDVVDVFEGLFEHACINEK
jgi:hypothetical protein